MGEKTSSRPIAFEGRSKFLSEEEPAKIGEAIDAALAAARDAGYEPGDVFDIQIQATLREENQNVRVYSAIATRTPGA